MLTEFLVVVLPHRNTYRYYYLCRCQVRAFYY